MENLSASYGAHLCDLSYTRTDHTFTDADIAVDFEMVRDGFGREVQLYTGRGTTKDARDWILDARFWPTIDYDIGCVPPGFDEAAELILPEIYRSIDLKYPVAFTGHSLGGAFMLDVAGKLIQRKGITLDLVLTYGAPRAGGRKLRNLLVGTPIYQFRRGNDPIPNFPWVPFVYYHQRSLFKVGVPDYLDPISCHHAAGYYEDVKQWESWTNLGSYPILCAA